jgi:hypothetical protein
MTRGIGSWRRRGNGAKCAVRTPLKNDEYQFTVTCEVDNFRMAIHSESSRTTSAHWRFSST